MKDHWEQAQWKRPWQKLGQIFRTNVGYNPTHGKSDRGLHPILSRQFKGMKNSDPGEKQQKALEQQQINFIIQNIYWKHN
jgi:hypothetical protein